jgi:hypothetical protein
MADGQTRVFHDIDPSRVERRVNRGLVSTLQKSLLPSIQLARAWVTSYGQNIQPRLSRQLAKSFARPGFL